MNKIERVRAALAGEKVDRVPVGLWYHYINNGDRLVKPHLDFIEESKTDFLKIMCGFLYDLDVRVEKPSDWRKVKPAKITSSFYQKQLDLIKRIVDQLDGKCMIINTVFNPYHHATHATSEAMVDSHLRTDPESVSVGLAAIAEIEKEFIQACLAEGIDGIYYSVQGGEKDRFEESLFVDTVKKYDLEVINTFKDQGTFNALHLCGANMRLSHYAEYPLPVINWDVKANDITLKEGKELFKRTILGGINNRGPIVNGTHQEIQDEVYAVLDEVGSQGLILGADCTIPNDTPMSNIHAAVEAAKSYKY